MSQDEITLICEGPPRGRDVRWLNLALSHLAQSFELAGRVRVVPGGSKADLGATVRGMREALSTQRVYAVRDRDYLRARLLNKDRVIGVYSLTRYCIESYVIEPEILEAAFELSGTEGKLIAMAERRFWSDIARAVLDTCGYILRNPRVSLTGELTSKTEVLETVQAKIDGLRGELFVKPLEVAALIDEFECDMRTAPLWTRVDGKHMLNVLEQELRGSVLPGGDLEGQLFKWCSRNNPPRPFVAEVKQILESLTGLP